MNLDRSWMYKRFLPDGALNPHFVNGLESFIVFATSHPSEMDGENIKCPCKRCENRPFLNPWVVRTHIGRHGFMKNYSRWKYHGETSTPSVSRDPDYAEGENRYVDMVFDAAGPVLNVESQEQPPNPQAQQLYDMLKAADNPIWPGCKTFSQLSLVARLMNWKAENSVSVKAFDDIVGMLKEAVPEDNIVPDCHVMMQRILPIAFKELLPIRVWNAITELCLFFCELCSASLDSIGVGELHDMIPIILCKLELLFPPSFFNSMEHLPVHLADEARIDGPVQYRWMYPFERYLRKLKNNVKNKGRVEGSICNAYWVEEASTFCSFYFEDHVNTKARSLPRNYDGYGDVEINQDPDCLDVFKHLGRPMGRVATRFLSDQEFNAANIYVLLNCREVEPETSVGRGTPETTVGRGTSEMSAGRGISAMQIGTSRPPRTAVEIAATVEQDLTVVRRAPDGRIILDLSTGLMMPSADVATALRKSFEAKLYPTGLTWGRLTQGQRDDYFEEFKKKFTWAPASDGAIRPVFESKAGERYKDFVHKQKAKRPKGRPAYISEEVWAAFCAHWDSEEAKAQSNTGRKNRLSEPDGPGTGIVKHKGGSRSAVATASKLRVPRDEVGYAVFHQYHKTKDGDYVDAKSARIDGEVQRRRTEFVESQPDASDLDSQPAPFPVDVILKEVVGGVDKKKRMFGVGSLVRSAYAPTASSIASSQGTSQVDVEAISRQVEAQVAEQAREIEARMQASVELMREEMRKEREAARIQREADLEEARKERERLIALLLKGSGAGGSDHASS